MKLLLSPLAADDLHSIHSYISEELDNPSAAGRLIKDIVKAYKQLKDTPLIGSLLDAKINIKTDFRYLVCRGYMIFYKVDGNAVYIYRIINGRRDAYNQKHIWEGQVRQLHPMPLIYRGHYRL